MKNAFISAITMVFMVLMMSGCATSTEDLKAVLDAQTNARPTLSMSCPAGGCSLEYTDPRDRNLKIPTNGYDALVAVTGQVTNMVSGAVVPFAIGAVAVHGFDALKGSGAQSTVTNTDSHDQTAKPTVVTQPAPTVVNPVVVTQPTPVQIPASQVVVVGTDP